MIKFQIKYMHRSFNIAVLNDFVERSINLEIFPKTNAIESFLYYVPQ